MTQTHEIEVEIAFEDGHASDPRSTDNAPHTVLFDPADAQGDDWDLIDLEWRANESAAVDAYERGLSFA